ncbi:MAG: thiamine pyrophosphate-dependent dehydrogenase E1 component subunit alpha, partial [Candidatus Omnitrophica bacterium]|nr:thiamine pyrophosphate-dependent dehydrogenase E1 component subunit alpha [Candidatus Omnitrophota bacterium]
MQSMIYPTPLLFEAKKTEVSELKKLLVTMIRIREFEERIAGLVSEGKVKTPCHFYIGQEAVATGVCATLDKGDYAFGTHRSHGHYLAKGGDMNSGMAEIFCRTTGCSKGRGGSMHLVAPEVGILGTSSIVAGGVPLGVGAALAERIRGTKHVSVVFHGDGVPEEGVWNESLNLAAIKKLPVVFICENNLYCTHLPLKDRRVDDNIPELAAAHGVPAIRIDGNNVLEVFHKTREVVEEVRNGAGPRLIECRTYRWLGHVGPKDDLEVGLRNKEEVNAWKARCPIRTY